SYGIRAAHEAVDLMSSEPEYTSSWFGTGGDSLGSGSGGINLKNWADRKRSAAQVQAEINARGAALTDVRVSAYQGSALPAASSGLPVQMVIRSPQDFPSLYSSMERIKAAARNSGLFAYVDSDLAFDSPEARLTIDRAKAGDHGRGELHHAIQLARPLLRRDHAGAAGGSRHAGRARPVLCESRGRRPAAPEHSSQDQHATPGQPVTAVQPDELRDAVGHPRARGDHGARGAVPEVATPGSG